MLSANRRELNWSLSHQRLAQGRAGDPALYDRFSDLSLSKTAHPSTMRRHDRARHTIDGRLGSSVETLKSLRLPMAAWIAATYATRISLAEKVA